MPDSGKLKKKKDATNADKPETGLLVENKSDSPESETTGLLIDENETALLDTSEYRNHVCASCKKLEIIEEILIIHSEEVIG